MSRFHPALILSLALCATLAGQDKIDGEGFSARTLTALSASKNKKGDRFSLQVLTPERFKGAIIEGVVARAKAAGKVKGKSELRFNFDKLVFSDGENLPIVADLTEVQNSQGVAGVDEEGRVIGKSSKKKDLTRTALLSGIGAAIGAAAGGGSGAAKGAAIGAAIGLTIAFSTRGADIVFAPGSVFELQVTEKNQ